MKVWIAHIAIVVCTSAAILFVAMWVPPLPATAAWLYGGMAVAAALSFWFPGDRDSSLGAQRLCHWPSLSWSCCRHWPWC